MRRQTLCIPLIPLVLLLCLSGCQGSVQENNLALALRADFLAMDGCSGTMDITADYGERVYAYTVSFSSTQETGMTMVITAPQEVAGITATIAEGQTYLTFDGVQLETGPLNEEGLSPLDALPAFLTAMQSGYMAETGSELLGETETLRIETILWFDQATKDLLQGELRSEGTTIVRCVFSSFALTQKTTEKG